jgi:VIT1/CCC1 family predicted Fe2+/Mn2+ transporter
MGDSDPNIAAPSPPPTPPRHPDRDRPPSADGYLRDFIYGGIDGAVTTFAVVSGVAGAGLSPTIIIVLGAANLVADGFSMAVSNFLGTRAQRQQLERVRATEQSHIDLYPEHERDEIRAIFAAKGFSGDDLDRAVQIITSDRRQWVETMLREEFGLATDTPSAIRAAATTFVAFILMGALPLLPFVYAHLIDRNAIAHPFLWSAVMTGIAMFLVGALKSRFVEQRWIWAGLETLAVGGGAAALAYFVGLMLKPLAG